MFASCFVANTCNFLSFALDSTAKTSIQLRLTPIQIYCIEKPKNRWFATDLFHNDVKHGKRDVRRNLIGFKRTFIIAEPIKFRVS